MFRLGSCLGNPRPKPGQQILVRIAQQPGRIPKGIYVDEQLATDTRPKTNIAVENGPGLKMYGPYEKWNFFQQKTC